jgi:hypothetical protein
VKKYHFNKNTIIVDENNDKTKLRIFQNNSFISKKLYLYQIYHIEIIKGVKNKICSFCSIQIQNIGNITKIIISLIIKNENQ